MNKPWAKGISAVIMTMLVGLTACSPKSPVSGDKSSTSQTSGTMGSTSSGTGTASLDESSSVDSSDPTAVSDSGGYQSGDDSVVYITNPGKWITDARGRTTVDNLPIYSFDEDKYYNATIQGGSTVRAKAYVRGIGADMSHKTEGYNLSAETQAKDAANLQLIHANAYRTWGYYASNDTYESSFRQGLTRAVTWIFNSFFPRSQNASGAASTGWQYTQLNSVKDTITKAANSLSPITFYNGINVFLLANEPSNYQQGGGGYDANTIDGYRQWLKNRFGSIATLNRISGTKYTSFDKVYATLDRTELNNSVLKYEHFLYLRSTYEAAVKFATDAIHKANPGLPIGMAGYDQGTDPYSAYARIGDYMSVGSTNIYALHRRNLALFTFDVDRFLSMNSGKPFFVTETGWPLDVSKKDPFSDINTLPAARKLKQIKALLYMRPQVQGSFWFNYGYKVEGNNYWSIVDENRKPILTTYALSQVYNDIEYLDQYFVGASSSPQVAITDQQVDNLRFGSSDIDYIMTALYAKGITADVVTMSDSKDMTNLKLNKLVLADQVLYQNPNGSDDIATALVNYLKKPGTSVLALRDTLPTTLYGGGNGLGAKTASEMHSKYANYQFKGLNGKGSYGDIWSTLAPFIHGDFVKGMVAVKKNTINESAVRILDTYTPTDGFADPSYQVQQQLVYKNGHVYLSVVNTGSSDISDLNVTVGINNGVKFNLHPTVLKADGAVTATRPTRAIVPSWVKSSDSKIAYGTVKISNLSTYAFIDLGMAVTE